MRRAPRCTVEAVVALKARAFFFGANDVDAYTFEPITPLRGAGRCQHSSRKTDGDWPDGGLQKTKGLS